MDKIPLRNSLPNQTAELIVQMIKSGELSDFLPGERELASRFQIGRDTLRTALELLENDEFITPSQHGKRRQIIHKSGTNLSTLAITKKICFLSPKTLSELPPWMLVEVDILRGLLNKRGYEFDIVHSGALQLKNPESRLNKEIEDHSCDLWILYQCPAPVQQWFKINNIPTIVRGYCQAEVELPSIDTDWKATAHHAGSELLRARHEHVGLLIPNTNLAGLIAAESGLRQSVEINGGGNVHKIVDKTDHASAHRALEIAFKLKNPPTAIVATRMRHVLTTITWLAKHRIRIPHDLSLISLTYESWFDHITPRISHYHSDPSTIAKTVMRMIMKQIENKGISNESKLIIPDFVKGSSVKKVTPKSDSSPSTTPQLKSDNRFI